MFINSANKINFTHGKRQLIKSRYFCERGNFQTPFCIFGLWCRVIVAAAAAILAVVAIIFVIVFVVTATAHSQSYGELP